MTADSNSSLKRILIVDDELIVAMDTEMQLLAFGFDVVGIATDCDEALGLLQSTNPDLVLMDVKLQGLVDGVATAEAMHRIRPIPVVFVTAYGSEATRRRLEAVGACAYLAKPYRPEDLLTALNAALRPTKAAAHGA